MNIHAIDVNSKFELSPGFKDIEDKKTNIVIASLTVGRQAQRGNLPID